jgi:hypothetical protein
MDRCDEPPSKRLFLRSQSTDICPFQILPLAMLCIVSYLDMDGVRHTVEVEADSMYEAATLAITKFRTHDIRPAGMAQLEVEIRSSIVHTLTVKRLEGWLKAGARSPKEMATKERLRALL